MTFRQLSIETDYGRMRAATIRAMHAVFGPLPEPVVEEVARLDEPPVSGKRVRLRADRVELDERTTIEVLPDRMLVLAHAISLDVRAMPHELTVVGAGPIVVDGDRPNPSVGFVRGVTVRYRGPEQSVGVAFAEALARELEPAR